MAVLTLKVSGAPKAIRLGESSEEAARQATRATAQADRSETAASYAEAMTGPTYANAAAGLAATADGQGFAVDNGDGSVTVWRNVSGIAVEQRTLATTAYLAGPGGAASIGFTQSGMGAVPRLAEEKFRDTVSVFDFMSGVLQVKVALRTAVDADAADITSAINTAIVALGAAGGGELFFPAGLYQLTDSNPGAVNWDNNRCIYVGVSNIHLRGAGRGASQLRVANGGNGHAIQFGQRVTSVVTVDNCSFRGFEIDGNRANQTVPTDTDYHWSGVAASSNCESITIEDFYIHDTQYYGIGMQRTGIKHSTIRNGLIANTGDDGIDWKNDDGDGFGNVVENVTMRYAALQTTLTDQKAAFDFRSGIQWRALTVNLLGSPGKADTCGLRVQVDANSTPATIPAYPTVGSGLHGTGVDGAISYGLRLSARMSMAKNVHLTKWDQGIRVSAVECRVSDFDTYDNVTGVVLTASGAEEADLTTLSNGVVRGNTSNGILCDSVDEVDIIACDVRSNGTGLNVAAGSSNVRMVGGSLSSNTTNLTDNGTNTIVRHVSGFRTSAAVTGSLDIASTGIKSLTIPHTLAVTPGLNDVMLTLQRATNVGDWELGLLWVTNTDANNIYVQARVLAASATPGAVATVRAMVNAKARL